MSFLSQNIAWSAPASAVTTVTDNHKLSPSSHLDNPDLAAGFFAKLIKQWAKIQPNLEFIFVKLNSELKALDRSNINVILSASCLKIISPFYTITVAIDENNAQIFLDIHDKHTSKQISFIDPHRVVVTDKIIPGINTINIPCNQNILIIERNNGDSLHYAGNFIKKLKEQNSVQTLNLRDKDLDEIEHIIQRHSPSIIFFPENQPVFESFLHRLTSEFTVFYYESPCIGHSENAYYPVRKKDVPIGVKSIRQHKSQVERTPFDIIARLFAKYTGRRHSLNYAHSFTLATIENGNLVIPQYDQFQKIDIESPIPLLIISPHPDDLPIGIFGLVRDKLRRTRRGQIGVKDLVITCGELGVIRTNNLYETITRRESEDKASKDILSSGVCGRIESKYFRFLELFGDFADDRNDYFQRIKDYLDIFCKEYKNALTDGFTIVLPHPEDRHPTHIAVNQMTLEALKSISSEKDIKITVLFSRSVWTGDYNTYYISNKDISGNKISRIGKETFTYTVGELAAERFGLRSPSPKHLGGEYTERFRRVHYSPNKYLRIPYHSAEPEQKSHRQKIIERCDIQEDYEEMSQKAAKHFIDELRRLIDEKGEAVACFFTGNTPIRMYEIIRTQYRDSVDWSKVTTFNLDEYLFGPGTNIRNHISSYRYYMHKHLFNELLKAKHPLRKEKINFPNGFVKKYENEIRRYKKAIQKAGGIDICLAGIGKSSHLAFSEPCTSFTESVHRSTLTQTTKDSNKSNFDGDINKVPDYAITMGFMEIMSSRKVMLIASGISKANAVKNAILGSITEAVPASILQAHLNVRYFLDKDAYSETKEAILDKLGADPSQIGGQALTESAELDEGAYRDGSATRKELLKTEEIDDELTDYHRSEDTLRYFNIEQSLEIILLLIEKKLAHRKIIFDLKDLLQSGLNSPNRFKKMKILIEKTQGVVYFYAGSDYILDPDYEFLRESIITEKQIKSLKDSVVRPVPMRHIKSAQRELAESV